MTSFCDEERGWGGVRLYAQRTVCFQKRRASTGHGELLTGSSPERLEPHGGKLVLDRGGRTRANSSLMTRRKSAGGVVRH